tara:strand:+ start:375 stop:791 length:417 start_codon:yes stop_codon:yes gene_type:complete
MAYTKPDLRKRIVSQVKAGSSGGKPGQWSARKAQIANEKYKKAGGGFKGKKSKSQKSLSKWTKEDWGTKSGKPSTQGKDAKNERYLPKKAIEELKQTPKGKKQLAATDAKKLKDTKAGKQHSKQPLKVAKKTAKHRKG